MHFTGKLSNNCTYIIQYELWNKFPLAICNKIYACIIPLNEMSKAVKWYRVRLRTYIGVGLGSLSKMTLPYLGLFCRKLRLSAKTKVGYLASLCIRSWWLYKDGSSSSVLQILIYCAMYWVFFHFPFRSWIHTLYLKYMESNTIKMNALWLGLYRITVSKIFSDNDFAKDGVRGVQSKSFYYRYI